jgi:DNA polymerase III epsilon subunit-like protein
MNLAQITQDRGPLVIIDTETGGVDPHTDSLLSVALVSLDGERRLEVFVREETLNTRPESMAVNGIDLEMIKREGLSPREAWTTLEGFLAEEVRLGGGRPALLVGHNIAFDIAFLKRLWRHAGVEGESRLVSHRSLDTHTLLWALAALGVVPASACGSDGAFKHYDVAPPEALRHTALGDAVATQALLHKLLADLEGGSQ